MRRYQKLHAKEQLHLFGTCAFLERDFWPRGSFYTLYDTPWDKEGREVFFHSDECQEGYMRSGSFDYTECEGCGRYVCEQNPANGWHYQFRRHEDLGFVCLQCYETEVLENGQPRSDFEGSGIKGGMFFSKWNTEPIDAGFEEVEEFKYYFVRDKREARRYNDHALSLIDAGNKVLTGYEALAYGASEGYITMLAKTASESSHSSDLSPEQPAQQSPPA